ncbi:hypothetical protein OsI_14853 [Oryza sativa Indica Group]|uniref:Uncharacterized protein n=1 Tax=Oryza sativa subsp. indica TaxID=39946 RepID=B8AVD8_ORYSI|nr:hypothetical protein OsI_14853 [Oryza sativa Indica Group]
MTFYFPEIEDCLRLIREYHVQILLKAQFFILFIGLLSLVVSGGPGCMDDLIFVYDVCKDDKQYRRNCKLLR